MKNKFRKICILGLTVTLLFLPIIPIAISSTNDVGICILIDLPIEVYQGESFKYTGMLRNFEAEFITVDAWIMYQHEPNGHFLGPIKSFMDIRLRPYGGISMEITQSIPEDFSAGEYKYIIFCGDYLEQIIYDSYEFQVFIQSSAPDYVYIDDDFNENTTGWGFDHFDTIQDGIDVVAEQGTVHVDDGLYFENIVIDKEIMLIGHDKSLVFIDGNNQDHVVDILADSVVIGGFTIQNSGAYKAGILVQDSSNVSIINNEIKQCTYAVALELSTNCLIDYNLLSDISQIGILLEHSPNNIIRSNTIGFCSLRNIYLHLNSDFNTIVNNNFLGAGWETAYDTGSNTWDDGESGNYWIDYTGSDEDGDGIGDTPYNISGGDNQDNYPLIKPWSNSSPFFFKIEKNRMY